MNLLTIETEVGNLSNCNRFPCQGNMIDLNKLDSEIFIDNISIPMPLQDNPQRSIQLKFRSARVARAGQFN